MYKSEYSLTWKIENFSFSPYSNGIRLKSLKFPTKSFGNLDAYLYISPRGEGKGYSEFISCCLDLYTEDSLVPTLDCELKMIGASGKILKIHRWNDISLEIINQELKCSDFLTLKEAVDDAEGIAADTLTVCCKLFGKNHIKDMSDETIMCTKIGVDRQTFNLKVPRGETKNIISSIGKKKFELSITELHGCVKIRVSRLESKDEGCFVDCNLILWKHSEQDMYCANKKHYFPPECDLNWEFPSTTLSNELKSYLSYCEIQGYHVSDLYFLCEFSSSSGSLIYFIPNKTETSSSSESTSAILYPSMKKDFQNLLQSKKLSDVKLRVDNETIEAHKTVLAARSPVFTVMFDHLEMAENRSGIVDIVDIDIQTLKLFLEFLYTDTVDGLNYETAQDLMMAAEKYQVLSLKEVCSMFLKTAISVENVCEILSLADAVNQENLNSPCIEFITVNSTTILSSPQWMAWMKSNMELATNIFSKLTLSHSIRN